MENFFFLQSGNRYTLTNERESRVHTTLPKGAYEVQFSQFAGYFLVEKPQRPLPPKLYGSLIERGKRILQTYADRAKRGDATGVLLSGEKGSGKTLLARFLIEKIDLPTLIVSEPYNDAQFLSLLTAGGPKLVLFDEFEKVYGDTDKQESLLSMLDGHYSTQNLTIATLNDQHAIIGAMKNRPSRFYYHYRYSSLEKLFIEEYCKDCLKDYNAGILHAIFEVSARVNGFNFDMLQALVEEMNRFGDAPAECMKHINIIPSESGFMFDVSAVDPVSGDVVKISKAAIRLHGLEPTEMNFTITRVIPREDPRPRHLYIDGSNFVSSENGTFVFEWENTDDRDTPDKVRIFLTSRYKHLDWAI